MSTKTSDLEKVLKDSLSREMTPAQKEAQRRSFVYGTTKIENNAITRATVDSAANDLAASKKDEQ
jgi:hypothetical protein